MVVDDVMCDAIGSIVVNKKTYPSLFLLLRLAKTSFSSESDTGETDGETN